jgi:NADH:ubiquinone oxidoreductase subunit C
MNILSNDLNIQHLSTITARDTHNEFQILYHFFFNGVLITIRTSCSKENPTIESIVPIFPGAILYERELNDLLGIKAKGHPDLRRLLLPDDWVGGHPLRKDWKPPQENDNK